MSLPIRCYQSDAVSAIQTAFETDQATLCVMPTGMGKTRTASGVIEEFLKPYGASKVMFLVHRQELAYQARDQIKLATGLESEIEMGDEKVDDGLFNKCRIVISTVQTQCAGKKGARMLKFPPQDFGLVIVDEAHHSVSVSWKSVLDYYRQNPALKILGLTATPDRTDEMALGQVFDSVAFKYPMLLGIERGWLVPIVPLRRHLKDLDYSTIRATKGELNEADVRAVLEHEKIIQPMVDETVRVIGDKKAIAFLPSVASSELFCDIFNRYKQDMAAWICGETPEIERKRILQAFKEGKIQLLCNCGICTEGFDAPDVHYVVICRPTLSRALFCQMIGRGTRPLSGILDDYTEEEYYWMRKQIIAFSAKPCMFVLEFTGNCGRHKLVSMMDALDGKYPEDVMERAKKKAAEPDNKKDTLELFAEAGKEIEQEEIEKILAKIKAQKLDDEAKKRHLTPRATYTTSHVDLFDRRGAAPTNDQRVNRARQFTFYQRNTLREHGHDPDRLQYWQGTDIIAAIANGPCSSKQAGLLKRAGYTEAEISKITRAKARPLIDAVIANNWKRPGPIDKQDVPESVTA